MSARRVLCRVCVGAGTRGRSIISSISSGEKEKKTRAKRRENSIYFEGNIREIERGKEDETKGP